MPTPSGVWMVLVTSPLKALMMSQVAKLNAQGVPSIYMGDDMTEEETKTAQADVLKGKFRFVYSSPESLLHSSFWSDVLRSRLFQNNLLAIVVDEAHCIVIWGEDFRPEYGQIGKIRVFVPHVHVIAFTATASIKTREAICHSLKIQNGLQVIAQLPVKPNLAYHVVRNVPEDSYREILAWIPDGFTKLREKNAERHYLLSYSGRHNGHILLAESCSGTTYV
eukprot:Lithocolla_globosa_v1_NODE_2088_length_2175_cov_17.604245.p1 type:complete len:222 gc:universal NODE_2088_length_2175_cov_17.604245:1266-601(-)